MFWNKGDLQKHALVLVLYLFCDITSFQSRESDDSKLQSSFIKKKKINNSTAKLQEIHS